MRAPAAVGSAALVTLWALGLCAAGQPVTGPPPGNYEAYSVALEYQPVFSKGYCQTDTWRHVSGSYSETHLAVHGLWPNYDHDKHGGAWYPQYCKRPAEDYTECQSGAVPSYCKISAATLAAFNTSSEWLRYAPEYAWGTLAEHEWAKHGSCTPWTQLEYFGQISALHAQLIQGEGPSLVTSTVGGTLTYSQLRTAFAGDSGGAAPQLQCKGCSLSEVRILYKADSSSLAVDLTRPVAWTGTDSCSGCAAVAVDQWSGNCSVPSAPPPPPAPPSPPVTKCVQGQRGPPCQYDPGTAGTAADPCLNVTGCLRCPRSQHGGVHYCTLTPAPSPTAHPTGAPGAAPTHAPTPAAPPSPAPSAAPSRGGTGPTAVPSTAAPTTATMMLPSVTTTITESVLRTATQCTSRLTSGCTVVLICAALLWLVGFPSPVMPYLALMGSLNFPGSDCPRSLAVVLHPLGFSVAGDYLLGALCGNLAIWLTVLLGSGLSRALTRRTSQPLAYPSWGVPRSFLGLDMLSPGPLFFPAHTLLLLGTLYAAGKILRYPPDGWWGWRVLAICGIAAAIAPAAAVRRYASALPASYVTDPQTPRLLAAIIGPGEWVGGLFDSSFRSYRAILQPYRPCVGWSAYKWHSIQSVISAALLTLMGDHYGTGFIFLGLLVYTCIAWHFFVRTIDTVHDTVLALVVMATVQCYAAQWDCDDTLLSVACAVLALKVALDAGGLLYTMRTHRRARLQALWAAQCEVVEIMEAVSLAADGSELEMCGGGLLPPDSAAGEVEGVSPSYASDGAVESASPSSVSAQGAGSGTSSARPAPRPATLLRPPRRPRSLPDHGPVLLGPLAAAAARKLLQQNTAPTAPVQPSASGVHALRPPQDHSGPLVAIHSPATPPAGRAATTTPTAARRVRRTPRTAEGGATLGGVVTGGTPRLARPRAAVRKLIIR